MDLKSKFIKAVYADHNANRSVQLALARLLDDASPEALIINVGAGETKLDHRVKTLELEAAPGIDFVGSVTSLPFEDGSVDLLITQEVLEHVDDPFLAMAEIYRVLKPQGQAYVQLPFTIGYHPCPDDFWRFTHRGIEVLALQAGFSGASSWQSVGPAVGFYRILVEFFSILTTVPFAKLYRPAKGFFSLLFYPVKWLDRISQIHPESHRIAGGFFVILKK